MAHRHDSGAGPTRHSPSISGNRSRSRVNAMAVGPQPGRGDDPGAVGVVPNRSGATSSAGRPGSSRAHPSASNACSRSRSASACSASLPRSTGRASALLIKAASPAPPSAGSGSPSAAARSTCATRRACAARATARAAWPERPETPVPNRRRGSPAASPRMPSSSASATGALTWSSDSTAASATRGQAARCSARAASRTSWGRSPGRSRPGRAHRGAGSGSCGAVRDRRRRPVLLLGRGQVSLVVRVREPFATGPGRRQPGQPGADASRARSCGSPSTGGGLGIRAPSETSRSQTARTRGERSMRQTLP